MHDLSKTTKDCVHDIQIQESDLTYVSNNFIPNNTSPQYSATLSVPQLGIVVKIRRNKTEYKDRE
jgi:uncharacterized protein YpiB (UPF0302 family)